MYIRNEDIKTRDMDIDVDIYEEDGVEDTHFEEYLALDLRLTERRIPLAQSEDNGVDALCDDGVDALCNDSNTDNEDNEYTGIEDNDNNDTLYDYTSDDDSTVEDDVAFELFGDYDCDYDCKHCPYDCEHINDNDNTSNDDIDYNNPLNDDENIIIKTSDLIVMLICTLGVGFILAILLFMILFRGTNTDNNNKALLKPFESGEYVERVITMEKQDGLNCDAAVDRVYPSMIEYRVSSDNGVITIRDKDAIIVEDIDPLVDKSTPYIDICNLHGDEYYLIHIVKDSNSVFTRVQVEN